MFDFDCMILFDLYLIDIVNVINWSKITEKIIGHKSLLNLSILSEDIVLKLLHQLTLYS